MAEEPLLLLLLEPLDGLAMMLTMILMMHECSSIELLQNDVLILLS